MQPEMLFRLGSTTKMFTAAALVTLSEQNKINLNEPIANRVKGLNAKVGAVTPHHLLSNSAGIRGFVPGKSGKIEFIFMGLYSAKRVL
jgi:D-alanyl-D-alanine carboxypeptidase